MFAGAVLGGLGVAIGAFGAHGLRGRLSPEMLAVFETGVRYHMYHALAILAAAALLPRIDTEDETFDKILVLAGESLDDLFESHHYLRPIADFRDEVAAALPRRAATQLIELCQVECSPRVSFETAETKTKER